MLGYQAAQWYSERADQARELEARYRQLEEDARSLQAKVSLEEEAARLELARAYLADLSPAALGRMSELTGFRGFRRKDPIKAMEQERRVLQRRIAETVADERYQRRQWLVGPEGELTRARAEAWEMFEPWQLEAVKFEDIAGFMELIDVGYDTPEFETSWWEPAYWRQWATGDRVCEQLGMDDFGDDVLPEYTRVAAERDKWKAEVKRWDDRIAEVHGLVQKHDQAQARIPRLPEIYLEGCHQVLAGFLEHADLSLLDQWAQRESEPDRGIRMALRRLAGRKAKLEFLEEFAAEGLHTAAEGFGARASKYDRKAVKFRRSKHYHRHLHVREIDHGFVAKLDKYQSRVGKYRKLLQRLERYESYEHFDLGNDPELWWIEMTGKRPGSYMPRLSRWYARQPDARPVRDDSLGLDELAQQVAAEAASEDDDIGYLS